MFKQGDLQQTEFTVNSATTNFVQAINTGNINDTDVWLYKLDQFGQLIEQWTKVPALSPTRTPPGNSMLGSD